MQKPQYSAHAKKNHLDLDYFPSKKRTVKVESGAETDRSGKMTGCAVDSLADSASKQSLDSARQMIAVTTSADKNSMQDNLDIAHRIR